MRRRRISMYYSDLYNTLSFEFNFEIALRKDSSELISLAKENIRENHVFCCFNYVAHKEIHAYTIKNSYVPCIFRRYSHRVLDCIRTGRRASEKL